MHSLTFVITTLVTTCALLYVIKRIQALETEIRYCRRISGQSLTVADVEKIVRRSDRHVSEQKKKRVRFADEEEEAYTERDTRKAEAGRRETIRRQQQQQLQQQQQPVDIGSPAEASIAAAPAVATAGETPEET
jgi:hypothetical protein